MILANHSFSDTLSYEQEDRCMNIVNECSSHNCIIHSMCHSLISLSQSACMILMGVYVIVVMDVLLLKYE